ncbi:hypothetical protein [uncultured Chryseobacterium sp.]|jgi:hypothetical protein|uniref:hypothetical protein n=1 Tax=uncultured Chryseobacterium sp. TaxID=259322 RepID=UPI00260F4ED2|nr:hypothetical protein [uncultured Chryseobacterium sp.]
MRNRLLQLFFLLLFVFGFSQDWKFIFESDKKFYYYKPNTENTAWVKIVSDNIEYYPTKTSTKKSLIDGYQLYFGNLIVKQGK